MDYHNTKEFLNSKETWYLTDEDETLNDRDPIKNIDFRIIVLKKLSKYVKYYLRS